MRIMRINVSKIEEEKMREKSEINQNNIEQKIHELGENKSEKK